MYIENSDNPKCDCQAKSNAINSRFMTSRLNVWLGRAEISISNCLVLASRKRLRVDVGLRDRKARVNFRQCLIAQAKIKILYT